MKKFTTIEIPIVKRRLYFIDNLKIFLIILVIIHHVGQAYGPTGGFWQYKSSLHENIPALGRFFAVNASFFMGLFFMISGYFISNSYDRKGSKRFIKSKLIRFGIPLLVVFFIIQPLEMYFYNVNYVSNKPLSFMNYYFTKYLGFGKDMSFGHLWFVENLFFFSVIYAIIRRLFLRVKIRHQLKISQFLFLIIIGIFIGIVSWIVRIWYPIDKWIGILFIIQSEVAHFPQYAILFIVGIIAYRKNLFLKLHNKTGQRVFILGIIMALLVYIHPFLPSSIASIIFDKWAFYESFMAVFLCWGLIYFFRENFNSTSSFIKNISETTYAAYIFHFPIVLAVQFNLDKVHIFGAWGKFITVSIISIIITFLISYIIRKITCLKKII